MGYKLNLASGGLLGINNISVNEVTTTSTLTANRISIFRNTGSITATLPAQADVEQGQSIRMNDLSTGGVITITPDGTDTIDGSTSSYTLTGDVDFVYEGTGNWVVFDNAPTADTATTADQVERFTGQPIPAVVAGNEIRFWTGSEADYDLITTKDPEVLYILTS